MDAQIVFDFLVYMQALSRTVKDGRNIDTVSYCFKMSGFEHWFQFGFAGYLQNLYPNCNVMTEDMPPINDPNYPYGNVDISISPKNAVGNFNTDYIELKCYTSFLMTENINNWSARFHNDIVKLNSLPTYTHNGSFNHIGKRTAIAIAVYDKAPDDEFSLIHNFQQHYTNDGVDYYNTIGIMQFGLSNVQPFYFEVLIYNALPIWSF